MAGRLGRHRPPQRFVHLALDSPRQERGFRSSGPDTCNDQQSFCLEAREPLRLPPYKGSTLRRGFGQDLNSTACFQPTVKSYGSCLLRQKCTYAYVFKTAPPSDSEVLSKNMAVPLPFVIQPPMERRTTYRPGETLDFGLVLVGEAINYRPYFVVIFRVGEGGHRPEEGPVCPQAGQCRAVPEGCRNGHL
jgi:hypothetical protein